MEGALKITYKVHSCVEQPVSVRAMLGEREVNATVPGLVVELVDGETHGHTFRFVPSSDDDMAAHKETFSVGSTVAATFEQTESAAAEERGR